MCLHAASEASDPRDKIFALVGIGADTQLNNFDIDYNLWEHDVAAKFVNFMMQKARNIDFICLPITCLPPISQSCVSLEDNFLEIMGTGISFQSDVYPTKYAAAESTSATAQLIQATPNTWKHGSTMEIDGIEIDEIAALMSELTELATFQPAFPGLRLIPSVNRFTFLLLIFSVLLLILCYIAMAIYFIIFIFLTILYYDYGFEPMIFPLRLGRFDFYTRFQDLQLPPSDPSYRTPINDSSDWIGEPHLVRFIKDIKHFLDLALRSSAPDNEMPGCRMSADERINSLYRTLLGNRTLQGTPPPPEWRNMFDVLIYGPSFVPAEFVVNTARSSSSFILDHLSTVPGFNALAMNSTPPPQASFKGDYRAYMYIEPLAETLWHNLSNRKLFITKEGHLGLTEKGRKGDLVSVLLGCSFPVLLQTNGSYGRQRQQPHGVIQGDGGASSSDSPRLGRETVHTAMCGTAYLDGFMEGQAIDDLEKGKRKLVTFKLR